MCLGLLFSLIFILFAYCLAEPKTILTFSRQINTCDPQDRQIEDSTTKVIWAYAEDDPVSESSIQMHDYRGVKSVRFNNPTQFSPLATNVSYFDVALKNVNIKFDNPFQGPTTNYWCSAYKVTLPTKNHIIRVEPLIDERNFAQVHHMLVYQCNTLSENELIFSGGCYYDNMPSALENCNYGTVVHGWAIGGTIVEYPTHVGYPISEGTTYFLLEIHYANPQMKKVVDSSGLRFYYTDQLRQYDAGVMQIGQLTSPLFSIPPNTASYPLTAWCPSECTNANYPSTGLKLLGGALHTHMAGKAASLRLIRTGMEQKPILDEPYYNFNYQDLTFFSSERQLLPGDQMKLICTYDTINRPYPTKFGLSTQDEMCLAYLFYYPKLSSNREQCNFGDFSSIQGTAYQGKTIFCGAGGTYQNWKEPSYTAYTSPSCNHVAPQLNLTTPIFESTPINLSSYSHKVTLDDAGKYNLYWNMDQMNNAIHGAVEVATDGWVGLGLSAYGMEGADILLGWIKGGRVYMTDRFATTKAMPQADTFQDLYNVRGYELRGGLTTSEKVIIGLAVSFGGLFLLLIAVYWYRRRRHRGFTELKDEETEESSAPSEMGYKSYQH